MWPTLFMDDFPYPLRWKLPGLKQEMGPPVLHIRYTMSGEAAIKHIFAVLRTTEPGFENLPAGFRTKSDILCRCREDNFRLLQTLKRVFPIRIGLPIEMARDHVSAVFQSNECKLVVPSKLPAPDTASLCID
jgi:hypothetical protein